MKEDPAQSTENTLAAPTKLLGSCAGQLEIWYVRAKAARWELSRDQFFAALERSIKKKFYAGLLTPAQVEKYFAALNLEDLALASACALGSEVAWEYFISVYREYLHGAAAVILRKGADSADARDLADSLFGELFGLRAGLPGERSLFRYFHGRSSLKTWLRAVLAQRHIDGIRAGRRFENLDDSHSSGNTQNYTPVFVALPDDPDRARYLDLFKAALTDAVSHLEPRDEQRLRFYYTEGKTLAETGRALGEHESSVSRNLDRIRQALRIKVEATLRGGRVASNGYAAHPGLDDAQIALCFEYVAEKPGDIEFAFPVPDAKSSPTEGQEP